MRCCTVQITEQTSRTAFIKMPQTVCRATALNEPNFSIRHKVKPKADYITNYIGKLHSQRQTTNYITNYIIMMSRKLQKWHQATGNYAIFTGVRENLQKERDSIKKKKEFRTNKQPIQHPNRWIASGFETWSIAGEPEHKWARACVSFYRTMIVSEVAHIFRLSLFPWHQNS